MHRNALKVDENGKKANLNEAELEEAEARQQSMADLVKERTGCNAGFACISAMREDGSVHTSLGGDTPPGFAKTCVIYATMLDCIHKSLANFIDHEAKETGTPPEILTATAMSILGDDWSAEAHSLVFDKGARHGS